MELVNEPVPVPLLVFVVNAVVGFDEVLQHTPRAVTLAPPSEVTLPPLDAVVCATEEAAVVVTVGATGADPLHETEL
jgi:hypothetical protein